MDRKRRNLTHSQLMGIIWVSICLFVILGIRFFSSKSTPSDEQLSPLDTMFQEKLAQKERDYYTDKYKCKNSRLLRQKTLSSDTTPVSFVGEKSQVPLRKQPLSVELNTADTLTLQLLYGIGPTFSKRIVGYRDRLGGFVNKEQLLEVYGITPEQVDRMRPNITIDTSLLRKIQINSAGLKQLAKHPYIEYYQARDIIRLRQQGVHFTTVEDLRAVPSMADSTLDRLSPYLDFSDDSIH